MKTAAAMRANRKYKKTSKGLLATKKYQQSKKGKLVTKRYRQTQAYRDSVRIRTRIYYWRSRVEQLKQYVVVAEHRLNGFLLEFEQLKENRKMAKEAKRMVAQGDILIRKVAKLPKGVTLEEAGPKGLVLAHSETGHDHVAIGPEIKLYRTKDPLTSYLEVQLSADIVHKRPFDTHETVRLPKGLWEIKRQREMSPDGWQMVQD